MGSIARYVGAAIVLLTAVGTARAATINVNTTNTGWPTGWCSGPPSGTCCGIRQAIQAVNTQAAAGGCPAGNGNNDTINLKSGTYTATSSLTLERHVTLHGTGVGSTILRGNMASDTAFFWVNLTSSAHTAIFEDLTLERTAGAPFVTGIYAYGQLKVSRARIAGFTWNGIINFGDVIAGAQTTILDSTIENNSSFESGAGVQVNESTGGSIVLIIQRSTIANNTSAASGGGVYCCTGDNLTNLWNVTISGNTALNGGGLAKGPIGYLQLKNVTVANNVATETGGGIYKETFASAFGVFGSIIGQNLAHAWQDVDGQISQMSESLISDMSGAEIVQDDGGNLLNVWPNLDPVLRNMGGPTKVHRPFPGSPVLDAMVTDPDVAVDQRGVLRPQFGRADASKADMGAFESSRLETETLAVVAKSSATHVIANNASYSNAQGTNLQAGAVNHFVTYTTTNALPLGTYNVVVGYKKGSNAGKFQFAVAPSGGSFTNVGPVQDGYASSSSWVAVNLGNVTVSSNGAKQFRFWVTTKHGSSSSYQVFPDFVDFTRVP
jgi:predicted outer membrane repeat protein